MAAKKGCPDFLELAKQRKTTFRFTDKAVKDSDIKKILEAGRWAPSFLNSQPWSFVLIRDRDTIRDLVLQSVAGYFLGSPPPVMIAVVLEPNRLIEKALLKAHEQDFVFSHRHMNIGMALSNIVHEATSLGISSAIRSPLKPMANKILKTPGGSEVSVIIALGYEEKGAVQRRRSRRPLKELVSYEYCINREG